LWDSYKSYSLKYLYILINNIFDDDEEDEIDFSFEMGKMIIKELIEEGYAIKLKRDILKIIMEMVMEWKNVHLDEKENVEFVENLIIFSHKFQEIKKSILGLFNELHTYLLHYHNENIEEKIDKIQHKLIFNQNLDKIEKNLSNMNNIDDFWYIMKNYDPNILRSFCLNLYDKKSPLHFSPFISLFKVYVPLYQKSKGIEIEKQESFQILYQYKYMKGIQSSNKKRKIV
jgi:hypothetical protein